MQFMSPELFAPGAFGKEGETPMPQALGLTIFQVCEQDRGYRPFLFMLSSGPYRWGPIPSCMGLEGGIPRASWGAPK